jgi:hypothetical protein
VSAPRKPLTFAFATPDQDEPHSVAIVKQSDLPKTVGKPALDAPGDSIVIFEAKEARPGRRSVRIPVSAPAGKILYFMSGLHSWMQGKIVVT